MSGAFEAKTDIISAFSLLPVILLLFGFRFQGKYYFDKMLSSVSSISCALFENFASFLHWLTQNYFQKQFYHSLYIFCGSPYSSNCHLSLQVIKFICSDLGDIARWVYPVARTDTLLYVLIKWPRNLVVSPTMPQCGVGDIIVRILYTSVYKTDNLIC